MQAQLLAEHTLSGILLLSFGLGILHAFDADHILAVSSLASRKKKPGQAVLYGLKWTLGHGGVLLAIASAVFFFRWQIPAFLPYSAEKLVGIILIVTGLSLVFTFMRHNIRLNVHRHGTLVHAHLATADKSHTHDHTPVLVGIIHGLAGSAPALALIPASLHHPAVAIGYIVIFSTGVLISMLCFGLLFGRGQQFLLQRSPQLFEGSRCLLGIGTTIMGAFWLTSHY